MLSAAATWCGAHDVEQAHEESSSYVGCTCMTSTVCERYRVTGRWQPRTNPAEGVVVDVAEARSAEGYVSSVLLQGVTEEGGEANAYAKRLTGVVVLLALTVCPSQSLASVAARVGTTDADEDGADEGAPAAAGRGPPRVEEPARAAAPPPPSSSQAEPAEAALTLFLPCEAGTRAARSCCLTSILRAALALSSVAAATPAAAKMRMKAIVELRYQRITLSAVGLVRAVMLLRMMAVMADSSSRDGEGELGQGDCLLFLHSAARVASPPAGRGRSRGRLGTATTSRSLQRAVWDVQVVAAPERVYCQVLDPAHDHNKSKSHPRPSDDGDAGNRRS